MSASARVRRPSGVPLDIRLPRFSDPKSELVYCLSRFVEREAKQCLASYSAPKSKDIAAQHRDWLAADRDGYELYVRAIRALEAAPPADGAEDLC